MATITSPSTSPVICTIASARAIHNLQQFLASIEPACGLTFVVVLRDDAMRDPQLAAFLGRCCTLPVIEAQPGTRCEADCVYLIPEFCRPTIGAGYLQFEASPEVTASKAASDGFLHSLALDQAENAGCIVLSGTRSCSNLGLRAMKHHGGICLAQSEPEHGRAMFDSPLAGFADLVVPVDELFPRLFEHFERRRDPDRADGALLLRNSIIPRMSEIHDILRIRTGHDFSGFRDRRAAQRIERRIHLLQLPDTGTFIARLKQDPHEADLLFEDLLFGLTEFFGDKESFEALARTVVPQIFADRAPGRSIRIWVAACATGEEAYAIGMIFRELIPPGEKIEIQIFASDIDERSLAIGRSGRYSAAIEDNVSPERLRRFFVREDGSYRVSSELRDSCLFTRHDLLRDPPFARMDLVVCRNLLIQMDTDLQQKLVSLLHFALRDGGFLFTGESENVSSDASFKTVDPAHRIFRKTPAQAMQRLPTMTSRAPARRVLPVQPVSATESMQIDHTEVLVDATIRRLEQDLRTARKIQQLSTEELQASYEGLCSANEEMSSLNEELQMVNAELAVRLDELSSALTDIQNLLASTQIAVVFLDRGLRVRLFTPAAKDFYNFAPGDIGRPIYNLRPLIRGSSLEDDAKKVMETLEPSERQVCSLDGETFYRMKILPYRTVANAIEGVVVTYTPDLALR